MRLTSEDRAAVTAAVIGAERDTDGEIVTIVADRSDTYHDVALHWALLAMFLALAAIAVAPAFWESMTARMFGWATLGLTAEAWLTLLMTVLAATFLIARLIFGIDAIRLELAPPATKQHRVRARAILLFRVAAERRTEARTGVLLYLSLAERRAEIVADAGLHGRVTPNVWGEAMAALLAEVRAGRPGDGMAAAVARIGVVLAEHYPKTAKDLNELPDGVIEL